MKSGIILIQLNLFSESLQFLLQIADIVDTAKISSEDLAPNINFVYIAKAMLRRKCSILQFNATFQLISQSEIESILKVN